MAGADTPFFNHQAPIDAYGNGGFRFAEMSHRGSLISVPSGIYAWPVANADALNWQVFSNLADELSNIDVMLLGTGMRQVWPNRDLKLAFDEAGLRVEYMDTGAAVRTYNVLLAEKRSVSAALIAVESSIR